jgi:hypothetical protein
MVHIPPSWQSPEDDTIRVLTSQLNSAKVLFDQVEVRQQQHALEMEQAKFAVLQARQEEQHIVAVATNLAQSYEVQQMELNQARHRADALGLLETEASGQLVHFADEARAELNAAQLDSYTRAEEAHAAIRAAQVAEFTALTEANAQVNLSLCRVESIAQERHDEAMREASTSAEMKLHEMQEVMAVRSAEFALRERQSAVALETSALERLQNMERTAESRHEDILRVRDEEAQARAMSELQTLQANLAQRARLERLAEGKNHERRALQLEAMVLQAENKAAELASEVSRLQRVGSLKGPEQFSISTPLGVGAVAQLMVGVPHVSASASGQGHNQQASVSASYAAASGQGQKSLAAAVFTQVTVPKSQSQPSGGGQQPSGGPPPGDNPGGDGDGGTSSKKPPKPPGGSNPGGEEAATQARAVAVEAGVPRPLLHPPSVVIATLCRCATMAEPGWSVS